MNTTTTKVTDLPAPGYPMLTRMISKPIFRDEKTYRASVTKLTSHFLNANPNATRDQIASAIIDIAVRSLRDEIEPMVWVVGESHPLVPGCKIARMFRVDDDIRIYASPSDPTNVLLARNFIPVQNVLLGEEAMPLDVFVTELTADELGDDDDLDPDEPDEPEPPPVQANGQQPVS